MFPKFGGFQLLITSYVRRVKIYNVANNLCASVFFYRAAKANSTMTRQMPDECEAAATFGAFFGVFVTIWVAWYWIAASKGHSKDPRLLLFLILLIPSVLLTVISIWCCFKRRRELKELRGLEMHSSI